MYERGASCAMWRALGGLWLSASAPHHSALGRTALHPLALHRAGLWPGRQHDTKTRPASRERAEGDACVDCQLTVYHTVLTVSTRITPAAH